MSMESHSMGVDKASKGLLAAGLSLPEGLQLPACDDSTWLNGGKRLQVTPAPGR